MEEFRGVAVKLMEFYTVVRSVLKLCKMDYKYLGDVLPKSSTKSRMTDKDRDRLRIEYYP
jgi:hypothetical protein